MRSTTGNFYSCFIVVIFLMLFSNSFLQAADPPAWLEHVAAKEITKKSFIESQIVLDPLSISTIRLEMSASDYNSLITNTGSNSYLLATMTYESPTIPLQTIEQVGVRLRGAVARGSHKKSFKISFRAFGHDDREFYSLRKLNLNCDFQDVHLMRAKTSTDLFRKMGVPAARVGYAELYINNEYRGLFANSEDIDKPFLNTRFGDNNGDLYKCDGATMQNGSGGYQLTTNEETSDNSDILEFIDDLNNTPIDQFKEEIEKVLDVDEWLMSLACNVLLGAWDDYWNLAKNFYFYHDVVTDQFNHIPHDFDGSLGTDWYHGDIAYGNVYNWSRNSGRPMVENLLAVPEYRDRYTHYLMMLCMYPFSLEAMEPEIDRTADMIRDILTNDPYWGWQTSDFDDAFDHSIPRGSVKFGMKEYIELRQNSALEQLESVGPFIKQLKREPLLVNDTDAVTFSHLVVDQYSVNSVTLVYKVGSAISEIPMLDNGAGADESANDFVYTAQIPAISDSGMVQYYVESTNNKGRTSRYPAENEWESYSLNYQPPNLLINELLAQNDAYFKDNYDEYNDWFEIYNPTNEFLDLTGMYVSDDLTKPRKWKLGNLSIPPNGFLLLWADDDAEQGSNHVGFKLSGAGEQLGLFDRDENENLPIDTLSFGPQVLDVSYGRTQDGADEWIFFNTPTPGIGNRDSTSTIGGGGGNNGGGGAPSGDDITDGDGSVLAQYDDSPGGEEIDKLIDNNDETKYLTFHSNAWVEYQHSKAVVVDGYGIISANDSPERDPRNWEFQSWDESSSSWVTLHTVSNEPSWPLRFEKKTFSFINSTAFSRYRVAVSAVNGADIMQMAELEIYRKVAAASTNDITDLGGAIAGSNDDLPWTGVDSDGSPDDERIEKLIDNDVNTKYLVGDEQSWLDYSIDENALVTGYSITSANDAPDRDPRSWELQGWDASTNDWITLHSVENHPTWEERFQTKMWSFNNDDTWCKKYRLNLLAINGSSDGLMQMAELEIFGDLESATKVADRDVLVADYRLDQNHPNPFNPTTNIQFSLPKSAHVKLSIFNVLGQQVKTLIDQTMNPGMHVVRWDSTNEFGAAVTNSVYFYRLESELGVQTMKMMLLR
jgi:spore coat protein CotH